MRSSTQDTNNHWLRLDNAAKIYPGIINRKRTSVFRSSVELKKRIRAKEFLEAVQTLEERFPYYKVKLKKGFFWYYLESENLPISIAFEHGLPCRAFNKDELLFRVLVKEQTISVEFSHILTDGTGALEFLKSLLLVYLEKCGFQLPADLQYHHQEESPSKEEYEDAYGKYFKKVHSNTLRLPKAFHLPFNLEKTQPFDVLTAIMPIDKVLGEAKKYEVSLTEYLVAIYINSLQNIYEKQPQLKRRIARGMLRIEVPVNLRRIFPSATMRNFSLYVLPGIDRRLGHYTFEEIVKTVYYQMRLETDKKLIGKIISRNVSGEKNPIIRGLPLAIKSFILSKIYTFKTKQYSGVISNLGKIDFGSVVNNTINKLIFIPPPPNKIVKVNCAVTGFDNKLAVTFGNITKSKELERQFLTFLTAQGIAVKLIRPNKTRL